MRVTEKTLLHLWSDITDYVREKSLAAGLDADDAHDIVIDAYLKAQERLGRIGMRKNRRQFLKSLAWCHVMNELNHRNTISECMWREAVRLDEPASDETETTGQTIDLSDQGRGADLVSEDSKIDSHWADMTRAQIESERDDFRKVVTLLMQEGMTLEKICQKTRLSRYLLNKILGTLRLHFDACFQAYQRARLHRFERLCRVLTIETETSDI